MNLKDKVKTLYGIIKESKKSISDSNMTKLILLSARAELVLRNVIKDAGDIEKEVEESIERFGDKETDQLRVTEKEVLLTKNIKK